MEKKFSPCKESPVRELSWDNAKQDTLHVEIACAKLNGWNLKGVEAKTILVTGSTGWLGGKLCEALVARGMCVVGLARRQTEIARVVRRNSRRVCAR